MGACARADAAGAGSHARVCQPLNGMTGTLSVVCRGFGRSGLASPDAHAPSLIVSSADIAEKRHRYPNSAEDMAPSRAIGRAAGLLRVGIHLVRVLPGTRTSFPHAESAEEEFVYVIDGEVDAWIDGELYKMREGDLSHCQPVPESVTPSSTTATATRYSFPAARRTRPRTASTTRFIRDAETTFRGAAGGTTFLRGLRALTTGTRAPLQLKVRHRRGTVKLHMLGGPDGDGQRDARKAAASPQ